MCPKILNAYDEKNIMDVIKEVPLFNLLLSEGKIIVPRLYERVNINCVRVNLALHISFVRSIVYRDI